MPEENLEEKVEEKPEAKKGLAGRVAGVMYNAAIAAGATALGIATVGTTAPIIGAAVAAGTMIGSAVKGNKPLDEVVNESLKGYSCINAILYPVLGFGNLIYPLIPNADLVGKAARTLFAMTVHNAVFTGLFKGAKHLISNRLNPFGMYKAIKKDFFKEWSYFALAFAPGYALTANGIETLPILGYNAPTFAVNALPAVLAKTAYFDKPDKKEEEPKQEQQKQAADPAQLQKYLQQMQQAQGG